jgi:hypothetical protein
LFSVLIPRGTSVNPLRLAARFDVSDAPVVLDVEALDMAVRAPDLLEQFASGFDAAVHGGASGPSPCLARQCARRCRARRRRLRTVDSASSRRSAISRAEQAW